jgi:hypothetical protein
MKKNLIFEKFQKDTITYDEFLNFCKENLPKLDDSDEMFTEDENFISENSNNNNKYDIIWYD